MSFGPERQEPTNPSDELWPMLGAAELSMPLPPIPWVVEGLRLAPGAVSLVAGYGYSRKTMAAQSVALSVASGKSVFGVWGPRKGRVVHLDYEQGRRLTQERYQRLARGLGFEIQELAQTALQVCCLPRRYLGLKSEEELVKLLDGATMVIVDSLRAAFPEADENNSEVRGYLDVLTRVSERVGAMFLVIHHARKPNPNSGGTATHAIRGSGALFDACQSVFVFEGEKGQATKVHHQKERVTGRELDDFGLDAEDLAGPNGEANWGLRVRHIESEQMSVADEERAEERASKLEAYVRTAYEKFFLKHSGSFKGGVAEVRGSVKGDTGVKARVWAELRATGRLVNTGSTREPIWTLHGVWSEEQKRVV